MNWRNLAIIFVVYALSRGLTELLVPQSWWFFAGWVAAVFVTNFVFKQEPRT